MDFKIKIIIKSYINNKWDRIKNEFLILCSVKKIWNKMWKKENK